MPYDNTNTLLIKAVPEEKRSERGPVLRGELTIDPAKLKRDGWDGETPLTVSLWLREGETRSGDYYKFWSGPVEVDDWRQERNESRGHERRSGGGRARDRDEDRPRRDRDEDRPRRADPDDDIPF